MCLVEVKDHFVRSFAILTHMNMHDQNICMIVSEMSGQDKKYQRKMGHTNTQIKLYHEKDTAIFISHFRILSSFFERLFQCILTFTIWVLSNIFLSRIVGYKLGFVRGPTYHKYRPQRRGSGKSYISSIRYKKDRHRKKRRINKKGPRDHHQ